MVVPGCLMSFLLPLLGAALGQWLDGNRGGLLGLGVGFVLGCGLAGLLVWAVAKLRQERS